MATESYDVTSTAEKTLPLTVLLLKQRKYFVHKRKVSAPLSLVRYSHRPSVSTPVLINARLKQTHLPKQQGLILVGGTKFSEHVNRVHCDWCKQRRQLISTVHLSSMCVFVLAILSVALQPLTSIM